jgi:hypothetical protein
MFRCEAPILDLRFVTERPRYNIRPATAQEQGNGNRGVPKPPWQRKQRRTRPRSWGFLIAAFDPDEEEDSD